MFSVYADNEYTGVRLGPREIEGTPLDDATTAQVGSTMEDGPVRRAADDTTETDTTPTDTTGVAARQGDPPPASILPPSTPEDGLVAAGLRDARSGLPPASKDYTTEDYDPSLTLEGIAPPQVGASVGGPFGGGVSGGVALRFGDALGNQTLIASLQAQGTFRDIGGGVSYINRRDQLNWGGQVSHRPIIFQANTFGLGRTAAASVIRRAYITSANGFASYPLSPTRRFEFSAGGTRYGFGVNVRDFGVQGDLSLDELNEILEQSGVPFQFREERETQYLANVSAAYVRDFSQNGLTGPIRGGRWRLEVTPTVGSQNFIKARADVRRYVYADPFTFAFQGLHVGNYGAQYDNEFGVGNEYIGYPYSQGFVRGYNVREISEGIRENGGCTVVEDDPTASRCAEIDRLFGTRALTARAEVRVPLLGPERLSLIPFPYVPTTLAVFTDAGVTWTNDEGPNFTEFVTGESAATNIPVVSTGIAARFNVLGNILLEMYYARPFQRQDTTWEWGLRIAPGF